MKHASHQSSESSQAPLDSGADPVKEFQREWVAAGEEPGATPDTGEARPANSPEQAISSPFVAGIEQPKCS